MNYGDRPIVVWVDCQFLTEEDLRELLVDEGLDDDVDAVSVQMGNNNREYGLVTFKTHAAATELVDKEYIGGGGYSGGARVYWAKNGQKNEPSAPRPAAQSPVFTAPVVPAGPGPSRVFTVPVVPAASTPVRATPAPTSVASTPVRVAPIAPVPPPPPVRAASVPPLIDGAEVISSNFPKELAAGMSAPATITVRNTGTTTWTVADGHNGYKLGARIEPDPLYPIDSRVWLRNIDRVAPQAVFMFTIHLIGPETPGTYTTTWQMVHEGGAWFGGAVSHDVVVRARVAVDALIAERDAVRAERDALVRKELEPLVDAKAHLTKACTELQLEMVASGAAAEKAKIEMASLQVEAGLAVETTRVAKAAAKKATAAATAAEKQYAKLIAEIADHERRLGRPPAEDDDESLPVTHLEREPGGLDPFVAELTARGVTYRAPWAKRFLLATRAAREVGGLVLLAGWTGAGKTKIAELTMKILARTAGKIIPARPEWLNSSDLLGYVDPIQNTFVPADFADAIVDAAHRSNMKDGDDLYMLLLDEMNLARVENYAADMLSSLGHPHGSRERRVTLYPKSTLSMWERELSALGKIERTPVQNLRLEGLAALLDRARGVTSAPGADVMPGVPVNQLGLPKSLVLLGTLNTDRHTHDLSPKVLDRSFALVAPPLSTGDMFEKKPDSKPNSRLAMPPPTLKLDDVWDAFPSTKEWFGHCIDAVASCGVKPSHRLDRNARAYLREAHGYYNDNDVAELLADLVHLLIIPRIECESGPAKEELPELRRLVAEGLADTDEDRHDVLAQLDLLIKDAEEGRDVRGLRS